ncbi:MAG TPA: DUF6265 family protein [Thermoanaerobaculia bacterium]|nr:DUF6265 family protein [Thermoanaerobaculia bacterium]
MMARIVIMLGTAALLACTSLAGEKAPELADLSWISGRWELSSGPVVVREWWMPASDRMMVGMSQTTKDGRLTGFEYLRIEESEAGLVYQAMPGGKGPTPFRLKELKGERAVFENPAHDFPQRIIYWKSGASLCARIEGVLRGEQSGQEWCWKPAE